MSPFAKLILAIFVILMTIVIVGALRAEKKRTGYKVIIYLLLFAVFFTASSIFWTTDIAYDTETITHLEFGWPIPFEAQDQSFYNPPFPYPMRADLSGYSSRGVFVWGNFLVSIDINFILTIVVWLAIFSLISRKRSR